MYTKTDCLWGWCNVARKCQQQDFGHSIVFIVFHQSFTYILSTTSSSKPLVTWTNALVSLRRLAMLRLPVLCCHHLAYMERWTVRCLLLSCSLPFPLFLFHTLGPFVFPSLSSSLICSFCMFYWIKNVLFYSIRCACWIFLLTLQWITNTIEDYANYRQ